MIWNRRQFLTTLASALGAAVIAEQIPSAIVQPWIVSTPVPIIPAVNARSWIYDLCVSAKVVDDKMHHLLLTRNGQPVLMAGLNGRHNYPFTVESACVTGRKRSEREVMAKE